MGDSEDDYVFNCLERLESQKSVEPKKILDLCTSWDDFFDKVRNRQSSSPGQPGQFGQDYENILKIFPHCSAGEWITLTRPKPEHPSVHLPNSLQEDVSARRVANQCFANAKLSVLNAVLLFQKGQKKLEFFRAHKNAVSFVKNFKLKIITALGHENEFHEKLLGHAEALHGKPDLDSGVWLSVHLPKLGKVYAELRTCMKLCDEVSSKSLQSDSSFVPQEKRLQEQLLENRGRMLLHVRWLIEARLCSISLLMAFYRENEEFDIDDVLCTGESKKLSKLIEHYNVYSLKHMKDAGVSDREAQILFGDLTQVYTSMPHGDSTGFARYYAQGMGETSKTIQATFIYPLTVSSMLDILSDSFMRKVGYQVATIFSNCKTSRLFNFSTARKPIERGRFWEQASRIEIRPMRPSTHKSSFFRVIKRVAGIDVPDIDTEKAAKECLRLTKWFKREEKIVATFISGLGGKTKILRRSHNFQDSYLSDDAVSVASSSSRASSSLARYGDVKSVCWKDSWNHDAMKSITSKHIEFLTTSIPMYFHQAQSECYMYVRSEIFAMRSDLDLVLLRAVVSNLCQLNLMPEQLHASLLSSSNQLSIGAALGCYDELFCEMLGKTTPHFDKSTIQKRSDNSIMILTSDLCIAALQPLLYLMEFNAQNDVIAKNVLPLVEVVLNAGYGWIRRKIQEFFSASDIPSLLQMCLCDLRELTNVALDSLRLVESCHNHIETRRNQDSGTLLLATKHLHNIDSLITNMQMCSGSTMTQLGQETKKVTIDILVNLFPPQKFWIQKSSINNEVENKYILTLIESLLKCGCFAVSSMDSQSQLAGMTPVVNVVYETCLNHIAESKIKFSVQGAMQLSYDFSSIINFVTAEISGLACETRTSLSSLHSVKYAVHVAELLQSTSNRESVTERFRAQSTRHSFRSDTPDSDLQDCELNDKFWLSLRKSNTGRSKKWTSLLPCLNDEH